MTHRIDPSSSGELCVLVVDDNEHMRTLLRTLLKAMGIRRVVECKEGSEALRELSAVKPDFIITDFSMAPMDGLHLTEAIRRRPDESESTIPIIMVTAHTERRRVEAARDSGVNEILVKPINAAGLFQRIDEIVHRPRPFVRSPGYSGPCRRRHDKPDYQGPWRRKTDPENCETVAVDKMSTLPERSSVAAHSDELH